MVSRTMAHYGISAGNKDCICGWCDKHVPNGERVVEVGIMGYWGHAKCYSKIKSNLNKGISVRETIKLLRAKSV